MIRITTLTILMISKLFTVPAFALLSVSTLSAPANGSQNSCLSLMPCPQNITLAEGKFTLNERLSIYTNGMSKARQQHALQRMTSQFKRIEGFDFSNFTLVDDEDNADIAITVQAKQTAALQLPQLGDDESYQLTISNHAIDITANTEFGALHALTTLIQLAGIHNTENKRDETDRPNTLQIPTLTITDKPRFKWRGLLIDSVRHFMPIETLKRQLDGMAAAKLNVFHWHLTDDQGWRIESKAYPKLHQLASDNLYYSQDEIASLVQYASLLGIRVVPELDVPGHASAIAVAYPELITARQNYQMQRQWGVFEPLLDVSSPKVYQFIDNIVAEMANLFPDTYLHIGGDEVNPKQWNESPSIQRLMTTFDLTNSEDVQRYFNGKVQQILTKYQRKMMGWDEILHDDLPKDIVVQSWRGLQSLNLIAGKGYQALLSAGYYIDQPQATSYHYRNDPLANAAITQSQQLSLRKVSAKPKEQWRTWTFTMPRLKGSPVNGVLTLVTNTQTQSYSGYLQLNNQYFQQITIHSTPATIREKRLQFSVDSWMGPMRFELSLPTGKANDNNTLNSFTMIGNSYYPVEDLTLESKQETEVNLQPSLAAESAHNVLGGEATLWSEMVTSQNIDLRTWPRLFAIAERLWSASTINDSHNMYQRLMTIDDFSADIIGLQHQQQQMTGLKRLLTTPPANLDTIQALRTLAQMLEPAHYYTRHHLKYLKNQYHQAAELDNFVDYLPVESFTLITMYDHLARFQQGDHSALIAIKQQLLTWQQSLQFISPQLATHTKLADVFAMAEQIQTVNALSLAIVNRCLAKDFYELTAANTIDGQLIALQQPTQEIAIAAASFARELLSHCQADGANHH